MGSNPIPASNTGEKHDVFDRFPLNIYLKETAMSKKLYRWIGLRHPKTTQERRANQDEWGRARRNKANLVEAWDDVSRLGQRCWKEQRKTQYKGTGT